MSLAALFTANPGGPKKRSKSNVAKKGKKGKSRQGNPGGLSLKSFTPQIKSGVGLGLGALGAMIVAQNLIPSSYREGPVGTVARIAAALGGGWLASKVGFLKPYAGDIAKGGVAVAVLDVVAPQVLPRLQFNLLGQLDRRIAGGGRVGRLGFGRIDPRVAAGGLPG